MGDKPQISNVIKSLIFTIISDGQDIDITEPRPNKNRKSKEIYWLQWKCIYI